MPHLPIKTSRPALGADLTIFTQRVPLGDRKLLESWEIPNPNIPLVGDLAFRDERIWPVMFSDPVVAAAVDSRRTMVLGGGHHLEPGEGDGSEELFQTWSRVLEEHKTSTFIWRTLLSRFTGWTPFEIVGGLRRIENRDLFVPIKIKNAIPQEFRWTARGPNLVWRPPGLPPVRYLMRFLQVRMKWYTPAPGALDGHPYGHATLGDLILHNYAGTLLMDQGRVQMSRAVGYLQATRDKVSDLKSQAAGLGAKDAIATEKIAEEIQAVIQHWQATGILIVPKNWSFKWEALPSAVTDWLSLFTYQDDRVRELLVGGTSSGRTSDSDGGSRSASEVDERSALRRAKIDAAQACEEIKLRFFLPWSEWWGDQIHPSFVRIDPNRQGGKVPAAALPRISFPALKAPDLEILAALKATGVKGEMRINAEDLARSGNLNLIPEGEEGAFVDLQKSAPPSPIGPELPEERPGVSDEGDPDMPD